jgi:hypothetical protein
MRTNAVNNLMEKIEANKEETDTYIPMIEGVNMKYKSALSLVDTRLAKCLDLISRIEGELNKTLDSKI